MSEMSEMRERLNAVADAKIARAIERGVVSAAEIVDAILAELEHPDEHMREAGAGEVQLWDWDSGDKSTDTAGDTFCAMIRAIQEPASGGAQLPDIQVIT
jgi:hypothetical protein